MWLKSAKLDIFHFSGKLPRFRDFPITNDVITSSASIHDNVSLLSHYFSESRLTKSCVWLLRQTGRFHSWTFRSKCSSVSFFAILCCFSPIVFVCFTANSQVGLYRLLTIGTKTIMACVTCYHTFWLVLHLILC